MKNLTDIERTRQTLLQEEHKTKWRDIEVTYIWGATATGKTRHVMEKHGYGSVYRVVDYKHPFDSYEGQDILVLDEFCDHFTLQDMNNYLDGYPLTLPCRYVNKIACYTKVYIISNKDLSEQYLDKKISYHALWEAFIRRIHKVIHFTDVGKYTELDIKTYMLFDSMAKAKEDKTKIPKIPLNARAGLQDNTDFSKATI